MSLQRVVSMAYDDAQRLRSFVPETFAGELARHFLLAQQQETAYQSFTKLLKDDVVSVMKMPRRYLCSYEAGVQNVAKVRAMSLKVALDVWKQRPACGRVRQ